MGTNGPTFDKESHYANKTINELQEELVEFIDGKDKLEGEYRKVASVFYTNHIEYLRMKIAERIGRKAK